MAKIFKMSGNLISHDTVFIAHSLHDTTKLVALAKILDNLLHYSQYAMYLNHYWSL